MGLSEKGRIDPLIHGSLLRVFQCHVLLTLEFEKNGIFSEANIIRPEKRRLPMEAGSFNRQSVLILIGAVLLCNFAGLLGALATSTGTGSWYETLVKPAFNPPSWLFAPVWTLLYILMGISLYLVIMEWKKGRDVRIPLILFAIQLDP